MDLFSFKNVDLFVSPHYSNLYLRDDESRQGEVRKTFCHDACCVCTEQITNGKNGNDKN